MSDPIRQGIFVLLLLTVCLDTAASDLYIEINRLRAGEGHCAIAKSLPPLKAQAALERVANDLSRGDNLQQSLKAAGYRASRSSAFAIRGEGVATRVATLLPRYCPQLQDAALTEVGIYLDLNQVWVVLAAPFAPAVAMSGQAAGQRVLDLVNHARAAPRHCGNRLFDVAGSLRWNDTLAEASRLHAEDMARYNYFSHNGRDGSGPAQRVKRAGYQFRASGENIAAGPTTPEDAVAGWTQSPGHCANLMNPVFTEMGVAFAVDRASEMGVYWAQTFATPR